MNEDFILTLGNLRSIKQDELKMILSWRNAPNVRSNMYTRHEISLTEHLAWWERVQARPDQQYFMYELRHTPYGVIAFNGIDQINQNSSWAFYAAPDAPIGTGSKMEYLALEHAFNNILLHKLYCEVLSFNKPVIKLHEKFGFKIEGIFRRQHYHEGVFVDIVRLGLLRPEWIEIRDSMRSKLIKINHTTSKT